MKFLLHHHPEHIEDRDNVSNEENDIDLPGMCFTNGYIIWYLFSKLEYRKLIDIPKNTLADVYVYNFLINIEIVTRSLSYFPA